MSEILIGDCRTILPTLPAQSVRCCVTSPPYWSLRDYGVKPSVWGGDSDCDHQWSEQELRTEIGKGNWSQGVNGRGEVQPGGTSAARETAVIATSTTGFCVLCGSWLGCLGLEPDVNMFVDHIVEVLREVRRILTDDGTLWLNLGDSYAANRSYQVTDNKHIDVGNNSGMRFPEGLAPKNLIGVPWRVAFALQADGWILRQDIIWAKPNPMPESVTDRCTKSHEYIFLLSKSPRYYYNSAAIAEPTSWELSGSKMPDGWDTGEGGHGSFHRNGREKGAPASHKGSQFNTGKTGEHQLGRSQAGPRFGGSKYGDSDDSAHRTKSGDVYAGDGRRNKRSVWTVSTQAYPEAHFATFPSKLIEPCILAGSEPGDTVLDPFAGSGTTLQVAKHFGRIPLGIELNPEYKPLIDQRLSQGVIDLVVAS